MSKELVTADYRQLKRQIEELLSRGREQAGKAVNAVLLKTYWHIGRHIVKYEQKGKVKAEYGSELLDRLSRDLSAEFGKGLAGPTFSR